jgi:RHS repeat-associated protein
MSPGIVAESDLSGNLQSEYVFFDGKRVARKDLPGGAVVYYFSDHLGTANVITDAAGNIKYDADSYPWGGELPFINNDPNHYKHTGNERDSETGLDYRVNRYSSNQLGRFLTPDWAGKPVTVPYADYGNPQSLNLYSYGKNNPMTFADPEGHCDLCQKIKNTVKGNGWRTDQKVKDDAQAFRNSVGKDQQVGTYNRDTGQVTTYNRDQLNKMSDSQVVQLSDQINSSEPANDEDLQKIGQALGQAASVMTSWGWNNTPAYNQAKKELEQGGNNTTHDTLNGKVPTRAEATKMIEENGGEIIRQDQGHDPGGVSTHTEPHINYRTSTGFRHTVIVKD